MRKYLLLFFVVIGMWSCTGKSAESVHPPLFAEELARTQVQIDGFMEQGFEVPTPKDMAGGYTHEVHKQNWKTLQGAAALYRHTGEERYAEFVRDILLEYAAVYRSWPIHPTDRSYATGKIFWQCLNDANWLVYVSLAYNDIYDWLDEATRKKLNEELFRPMADFLSVENPQFFNRIHNHSTWGNAAVGMIGLVMDDDELVQRALYGIPVDQLPDDLRDDDAGLIKSETGRAGFLAQLDLSFSPDGYFTEGPYYLRYALSPFLLFGRLLADKRPDINVLEYRDGILGKAIYGMLSQAGPQGDFFPLNDSQKGMSVYAPEVVKAVDYGYFYYGKDPELLSIAARQGSVTLDAAGLAVAAAIDADKAQPFRPASVAYTDGPEGTEGGVGVLRADGVDGQTSTLVMKYSAQGMGHGHFDKLAYSFYNETGEVIQDYGAARWVNIDQKGGGRYLEENNSWAKQSVAHNTLVIGGTSHYNGDIRIGEKFHPDRYAFVADDAGLQLISAKANNVYPGRELHRSQWLLADPAFAQPLLIDVFRSKGSVAATHDLPTWYHGQLLQTNFPYVTRNTLVSLGEKHGYQHLWTEASARPDTNVLRINFFNEGVFYTQSSVARPGDEMLFVRLGANDPEFNLRRDQAFIHRRPGVSTTTFVSVLETHGDYDPREEVARDPYGHVTEVSLLVDSEAYTAISFKHENGTTWRLLLANQDATGNANHELTINGTAYRWSGVHHLIKID
ncbi:heparinase II/III domain-containing protein [Neolewinella persica]|uniref:heparinase II/III domain-containing protein n=1 Tax=Neolewinella persica TaxID=70998 RepID=UPI00037BC792|nr:heparinase II/III family protein [Neolewinella persica]